MSEPGALRRYEGRIASNALVAAALAASVAAGYAVGTHSILVGTALGIGTIAVVVWAWPNAALFALALLYVLPRTLPGGLHPRDIVAGAFILAILDFVRRWAFAGRMLMPLTLDLALLAVVTVSAIGFISQPGETAALAEIAAVLVIFVAGLGFGTRGRLLLTLRVVRLVVLGIGVAAIILWFQQGTSAADALFGQRGRADALLGPNGLGTFLAIGTALEITVRKDHLLRISSILTLGALLTAIFLTGSRGAVLVLGVSLIAMMLLSSRRSLVILLAAALIPATALAIGALTSARIDSALQAGVSPASIETSSHLRIEAAKLAVHLMAMHPLTGVGYAQAAAYAPSDPGLGIEFDTHNEFLRIGAESGIPALLLLIGLVAVCLSRGGRLAAYGGSRLPSGAFIAAVAFTVSLTTLQGFRSFAFAAPWMLLMGVLVGAAARPAPTLTLPDASQSGRDDPGLHST